MSQPSQQRLRTVTRIRMFRTTSTTRPIGDAGGYQTLERLRSGELTIDAVLQVLDDGALKGLGGAGFPDRSQMALGTRRTGTAADGRERR